MKFYQKTLKTQILCAKSYSVLEYLGGDSIIKDDKSRIIEKLNIFRKI